MLLTWFVKFFEIASAFMWFFVFYATVSVMGKEIRVRDFSRFPVYFVLVIVEIALLVTGLLMFAGGLNG